MTREARDPKPSATRRGGVPGPDAQANGSGEAHPGEDEAAGHDENEAAGRDKQADDDDHDNEMDEELNLPIDPLLDWGSDPRDAEKDLAALAEEAIVAAERDEYLDALRRLQADFDNFRKRSMRQQTELLQRANEGLILRLLPVLDALDLATAHVRAQEESSDAAKALEQIDSLLRDILAREGVERIDALGLPFDPTVHDAVGGDGPIVADVMRAGYRLKSKVLRPAMVVLGA